jgi:predicted DNA-binding transcriptional regulator AlpA
MTIRKNTPARAEAMMRAETTLNNLPSDLGRRRILNAVEASRYWGVSLAHWRRMYRAGAVPKPIQISERRVGWRIGALADALDAREQPPSDA